MSLDLLRTAIAHTLPVDTSFGGETPPPEFLYLPPSHLKALRPECQLVVGTRGAGKTFWLRALGNENLRKLLGSSVPELDSSVIRVGFSEKSSLNYPDAATFESLIQSGHDAYDIWRTVIVRWSADFIKESVPSGEWREGVEWVKSAPEAVNYLLLRTSERLNQNGQYGLILFDALDRAGHSWQIMDQIVRGLLRAALWLKTYSRISTKIFLREDQLERTVTDFPDASKLLATKADLSWARHDLHGLLWQYLLNGEGEYGEALRDLYTRTLGADPVAENGRYAPATEVRRETPAQRGLFEALAGPWMGKDRRRGVPYAWIVNHLADGKGRTSPRSFIAAIRQAAEDTTERYPDYNRVLHYESIKRGVQQASEIRVAELAEDYPWVRSLLRPLEGMTVPISFEDIERKWSTTFKQGPQSTDADGRLPPQHQERGWTGIKEDLLRLGVFEERKDGRIDMPDLYRVGFGIGRRGGVKPRRK